MPVAGAHNTPCISAKQRGRRRRSVLLGEHRGVDCRLERPCHGDQETSEISTAHNCRTRSLRRSGDPAGNILREQIPLRYPFAMNPSTLDRAHAELRRRIEAVGSEEWDLPTPCAGWSVRDLVEHMAVGATMSCQILAGEPWTREAVVEEVSSAPDVKAEWERRTTEERAGFAAPGALSRTVAHPVMGEIPCERFLGMRVGDALLHSWDLARAIGADDQLDPELVAEVWTQMSPMAGFIGNSGFFGSGPSGEVGEDAPLQTRLLDLSGRRP